MLGAINHDGMGLDVGEVREVLCVVVTRVGKALQHIRARDDGFLGNGRAQ